MKKTLVRVFILMLGLAIAHLGVTLFLLADLGADPFNVLIQGIYRTIGSYVTLPFLTHGRVHICICILLIVIFLVADRTYVRIGTVLCMIFGGPIIDLYTWLLQSVINNDTAFMLRILINVLGCAILAFGMTIVIKSEAGTGPNDLLAVIISDKTGTPFGIIRVIVDVCFAAFGFLLGGTIGIGTVICAAVVGPVAGLFMPYNEKWISSVIEKIK